MREASNGLIEERPAQLEGVKLLVRDAHADDRGSFRRIFSESEYAPFGILDEFVEDNVSVSKARRAPAACTT